MSSDWISYFGYGSLVNRDTRPAGEVAHRARLNGWRRVWEHRVRATSARSGCTSLSVTSDAQSATASIEGVVVKLHRDELAELDEREAGYERMELPAQLFDLPPHLNLKSVMVYRSLPENRHRSDEDHPVLQSYVDCVLAGYHRTFAEPGMRAFMSTTQGWEGALFNDRAAPRYPRYVDIDQYWRATFDKIIQQHRPSNSCEADP